MLQVYCFAIRDDGAPKVNGGIWMELFVNPPARSVRRPGGRAVGTEVGQCEREQWLAKNDNLLDLVFCLLSLLKAFAIVPLGTRDMTRTDPKKTFRVDGRTGFLRLELGLKVAQESGVCRRKGCCCF